MRTIALDAALLYEGTKVIHVRCGNKDAWLSKPESGYEHDEKKVYVPEHVAREKGLL